MRIELFSLGVAAETLRANIYWNLEVAFFERVVSVWPKMSRKLHVDASNFFIWYKNLGKNLGRSYVTTHAFDRQKDGRTNRRRNRQTDRRIDLRETSRRGNRSLAV